MRVLHLTLKKKWFDMILAGEKKEEYRELKKYWHRRFICSVMSKEDEDIISYKEFDYVIFKNGYQKNSPTASFKFEGIAVGTGRVEWGAPNNLCYIIKLGKQIHTNNEVKHDRRRKI